MVNTDVAYFDPNTFGEKGYSMIGPLLLIYDKLVLYGPVGYLVEKSFENEELRNTSLTPQEFVNYIEKGLLVPLGFETFFDQNSRGQLYLPELRVTTDFDRDLISSPVLSTKRKVVPNFFKLNLSPQIAKRIIDNNELIKNKLLAEINREETLPKRYKDLQQHIDLIPKQLQETVGIDDPHSLLPYVIVYDLFNNRHVMEYEGTASIHSQHREFRELYRAIHGLEDTTAEESQQTEIIGEILTHCVSKINYGRLTSRQIDEFRKHYRKDFISFVESTFEKMNDERDFFIRREEILYELEKKFRKIQNDLSIGFEKLISMVPPLKVLSKPLSDIFYSDPGTKRNKFYHTMMQPISLKDRWAYQFVKLKK